MSSFKSPAGVLQWCGYTNGYMCMSAVTWVFHFIVFELPFCSKCPSAASENCLSVGQHWNPGLPTGAAVFCHSLYLQDPRTLQSSKWQTIHIKSCYFSNKVPSVICILPFSAMDIRWPTLPFSLDCCAHWLVPSTLQPYSSVTLSLDFLWERCHGFCHQQAAWLWTFLYPYTVSVTTHHSNCVEIHNSLC